MFRTVFTIPICALALLVAGCQQPDLSDEQGAPNDAVASAGDADHQSHAAPDGEGELLLTIMQGLGGEMVRLTYALMTDDTTSVADAAESIAAHAPIASSEIERIHAVLGAEMAEFEEVDGFVHHAAAQLRDAARSGDLQEVVRRLGEVQSGCISCHTQFRERLRTNQQ